MRITDEILRDNSRQVITYSFTPIDDILSEKYGKRWKNYRKRWNDSQNLDVINDIPLYILLELNSYCNLRCKMCKHAEDSLKEKHYNMPLPIFEEVIKQCHNLGVPSINIGSGTECTIHPQFKDIMLKVKDSGAIDKFFLTNGTTLSENMILKIFEGEYERVEISVDAASKKTYEKIRKNGNYEKLEEMILKLLLEKEKRKLKLPIIRLSFCVQNDNINEIDTFYDKWKNKVDLIEYQKVSLPCDFQNSYLEPRVKKCIQPFNRLTINYKGDIFPCCSILYQDEYCLGNMKNMTIYEAWHSKKMNALREGIKAGKLMPHCNNCLLSIYGSKVE